MSDFNLILDKIAAELKIDRAKINQTKLGLYEPVTHSGAMLYTSGFVPYVLPDIKGLVGLDISLDQAGYLAKVIALMIAHEVVNYCDKNILEIDKLLQLNIFVAAADNFYDMSLVANNASEILINIFGSEKGRHSRSAIGVKALPQNYPVEINATFALQ